MGLLSLLFGRGIRVRFEQIPRRDLFGSATGWDFASHRALREWVADRLANFACPACGQRSLRGHGLIVRWGKVRLLRSVVVPGRRGQVRTRDVPDRTVWRVYEIVLRGNPSADEARPSARRSARGGRLVCTAPGCGWMLDEPRRWDASLLDRYHVFPERLQMVDLPKPR